MDSNDSNIDFVALYTRGLGDEFQIRLDLLELTQETSFKLLLAIDTQPDRNHVFPNRDTEKGIEWTILIQTDTDNSLETQISSQTSKVDRLRVVRDPDEDIIVINFSNENLHGTAKNYASITAFIFPPGQDQPADVIGPVKFSASPPKPVPVVLYFSNVFEAATPSQALRRWNGAHSGPDSARHGLVHLLDAVEDTNVPVILSDLNIPSNLSALNYLGVLNKVRRLAISGLISSPQVSIVNLSFQPAFRLPGSVYEKGLAWSSQVSQRFQLPNSQALVAQQWPANLNFPGRYKIVFPSTISFPSTAEICVHGQVRVLCRVEPASWLETHDAYSQINEKGLTIDIKKVIVDTAFSEKGSLIFIGGDFGLSAWGIQGASENAFRYLRTHPWIRILSIEDLQTWPTQPNPERLAIPGAPENANPFVPIAADGLPITSGLNTEQIHSRVLEKLETLPDSPLTNGIWQWYFELLSAKNSKHHALNAATLGQLGHLIAGAEWASNPYRVTDCKVDLDWDGDNECVLSSDTFFATLEPRTASMLIGLVRTKDGLRQFIAPTFQAYSGFSDSYLWETQKGFAGDPNAIAGAFVERALGLSYRVYSIGEDRIEFVIQDMSMRKSYRLSSSSLEVDYSTSSTVITTGMLVFNPWDRFNPQWAASYPEFFPRTSIVDIAGVHLTTNAEISGDLFTSSKAYLDFPEDPNFDYSAGHHQLLSFGSFTVTGRGEFWIHIEWPDGQ